MTHLAPALGLAAALVSIANTIPYVRDTLRGVTRPHRGTWLIWSVLPILVCLSQRADGATWSLLIVMTQAVLTSLIFVLAISRGEGGVERADLLMIAIAGAGLAGWIIAATPLVATACVVVADLIAAALMVPKTWRDPESETLSTFALASAGGALAAASVGSAEVALLVYPVYFCLVNAGLALLIHQRRGTSARAMRPLHPRPQLTPLA
jgi:hypothetical protein